MLVVLQLAAISQGQPQPCQCPMIYNPVCGINDITYDNKCLMKCDNTEFLQEGPCPQQQNDDASGHDQHANCEHCHREEPRPVCGKNGKTYDNKCFMKCDNTEFLQEGPCPQQQNDDASGHDQHANCEHCHREEPRPVCGNNGKTYDNKCFMKCDNTELSQNGPCRQNDDSSSHTNCECDNVDTKQVCGRNGKTYDNECLLKCDNTELSQDGPCHQTDDASSHTNCECDHVEHKQVCGRNGKTYDNECLMKCDNTELSQDGPCS